MPPGYQVGFGGITYRGGPLAGRPVRVQPGSFRVGQPVRVPGVSNVGQLAQRLGVRVPKPGQPGTAGFQQHPGGAAPAAGSPGTQTPQSSGSGSPLDAQYYQNVADNQFKVDNQINALNLQGSQAQTALQNTLAQLAYQQPRAQLALEQRANQSGGLYSSVEGQNQGNLAYQYLGKQGAAQNRYSDTMNQIAAKIAALQQGEPLYDQGQADASAVRASNLAASAPAGTIPASGANPAAGSFPAGQWNKAFNSRFDQRFNAAWLRAHPGQRKGKK